MAEYAKTNFVVVLPNWEISPIKVSQIKSRDLEMAQQISISELAFPCFMYSNFNYM